MCGATGDLMMVKPDPKGYVELGRIHPLKPRAWAQPAIADGKLFIRDEKEIVCLDLK